MENQLAYRYKRFQSIYPFMGNYLVLSKSVRGMNFSKEKINKSFKKVPKSDYVLEEKDMLLENLYRVTLDKLVPQIPIYKATEEN